MVCFQHDYQDSDLRSDFSPDCPLSEDEQIDRLRTIAAERGWTVASVFSDRPTTGDGRVRIAVQANWR